MRLWQGSKWNAVATGATIEEAAERYASRFKNPIIRYGTDPGPGGKDGRVVVITHGDPAQYVEVLHVDDRRPR